MAFNPLTFNQILARMLDFFIGQTTGVTDVNVGSVARTLMEAAAAEVERTYVNQVEGLVDAIDTSTYRSFGFGLLAATAAYGEITLTRTGGYAPDIAIATQQRFNVPNTSRIYSPIAATTWTGGAGSTTKTISVQALEAGTGGNTPAASITGIFSTITGVASVTNAKAFVTGTHDETIDERSIRFSAHVASLPRSTRAAVEYGAKIAELLDANGFVTERVQKALGVEGATQFATVSSANLTPAAVLANTTVEQTMAFAGVLATDKAVFITKAAAQAGLGIVGVRVPSAGNIAITFTNNTAGNITPTAAESYTLVVLRGVTGGYVPTSLSAALSPVAVGANTVAEQTIAFAGVLSGDIPLSIVKPSTQTGLGIGMLRIPSAGNVAISFLNNSAGPITPTVGETYKLVVLRATGSEQITPLTALLTPASVASDTTAEQSIAFSGIIVTDVPVSLVKPTAQAGLGISGVRITDAGTIAIAYTNTSGGAIVPTAETYTLNVNRSQSGSTTMFVHNGVGTPNGQATTTTLVTKCQTVLDGTSTAPGFRAAGIPVTVIAASELDQTVKVVITNVLGGFSLDAVRQTAIQAVKDLLASLDISSTLYTSSLVSAVRNVEGVGDCIVVSPAADVVPNVSQIVVSSSIEASRFTLAATAMRVNIL